MLSIASSACRASASFVFCFGLAVQPILAHAGDKPQAAEKTKGADKPKVTSIADYRTCVDRGQAIPQSCVDALDAFVKGRPNEAFAAGKAVRATVAHWAAIPFFAKAFAKDKKDDKKLCSDGDVTLALIAGLSLPARHTEVISASRMILFDRCWTETHEAVLKELTQPGSALMAENVCPTLIEKKQSSPACDKAAPAVRGLPPGR